MLAYVACVGLCGPWWPIWPVVAYVAYSGLCGFRARPILVCLNKVNPPGDTKVDVISDRAGGVLGGVIGGAL